MQKLDKSKIEIQIVSGYWDVPRSGICSYDGRPCWFEEVKEGLGIGEDEEIISSPFYNPHRSKFELYALTKRDLDIWVNRVKYFAKELDSASGFYKEGWPLKDKESTELARSFVIDKSLGIDTPVINKSCCIGYYYDGAPRNTFDIDMADISHTYRSDTKNPTTASIEKLKELRPMLELFKNDTSWFVVSASLAGGLLVEFEFDYETTLDVCIFPDGTAKFSKCEFTKEYLEWKNAPHENRGVEPTMLKFSGGKL